MWTAGENEYSTEKTREKSKLTYSARNQSEIIDPTCDFVYNLLLSLMYQ